MVNNFKMERYKVLFFDFDGVILDSVNIKTEAFAKLFEAYGDDVVKKVVDYHLRNKGVSRYDKFRYYYKNILGKSITDEISRELDDKMNTMVMKEMGKANFIKGILDFLNKYCNEKVSFVISATPQIEIKEIVRIRGLDKFFKEVKGSPKKKFEHIKELIYHHNYKENECVMFGDADNDLHAATKACIDFVGINFKWDGNWVKDFRDLT